MMPEPTQTPTVKTLKLLTDEQIDALSKEELEEYLKNVGDAQTELEMTESDKKKGYWGKEEKKRRQAEATQIENIKKRLNLNQ